eukprot:982746-Pleurochrysis_carterae.AAC.1
MESQRRNKGEYEGEDEGEDEGEYEGEDEGEYEGEDEGEYEGEDEGEYEQAAAVRRVCGIQVTEMSAVDEGRWRQGGGTAEALVTRTGRAHGEGREARTLAWPARAA